MTALSSCMSLAYASGRAFMTHRIVMRFPYILAALARTSSAPSGFCFCGMRDEPVLVLWLSLTNPKGVEAHSIISSASLDR